MQLAANALDRRVITGPVEATAAGNILAQAIAAGEISGINTARQVIRNSFALETFEPDADSAAAYDREFARFKKVTA